MDRFIITGASGHLGNTVVRELIESESSVKLLLLPGEKLEDFDESKVEIAYGDVCDKEFLRKEITADSVVFHMAGIIEISKDNKDLLYKVNVGGTKNIADVALEKKVKKLVYTSSVHIITPTKGETLTEPVVYDETKIVGDYAKSKTMATKYVMDKIKEGLNAVIVYPSGIIGVNDYKISDTGHLFLDIINKDLGASVNGGYNFVDVKDVAHGVILAYKYGKVGEGYILSGNSVKIDEVFKIIDEKLGRRRRRIPRIAMWFVKMFASVAEWYAKLRKKKPLFTAYSLYTLTSNHDFDNQKAKTELHYTVRDTKETLCDTVDWFFAHKKELIKTSLFDKKPITKREKRKTPVAAPILKSCKVLK